MATKQTRELYRGKAIITNVSIEGVEDWKEWERRQLSELDKSNAFKIVYSVAEGDANGARHDVKVEISHRELSGKMLEYYRREDGSSPTQIDVALRSLRQQGILPRAATERDIIDAVKDELCGREVTVRVYEELGNDGSTWWPRCAFASKLQRLTGEAKAERLAAFLAGKPAPAKREDAPAAAQTAIPAPADDDDLPF